MLFHAVSCLCHCEYKNKSLGPGCLKPVHRGKAQTSTSTILNFFAGRIGPPFAPNIWNHPKIHFWHRQGNIRTSTDWCSSSISNSNSVWPIQHPQHRLCTVYIVFKTISGFYPIFFEASRTDFLYWGTSLNEIVKIFWIPLFRRLDSGRKVTWAFGDGSEHGNFRSYTGNYLYVVCLLDIYV